MITVNWATGVNMKVLRNGTNWQSQLGFVEDKTMSGKKKRRPANVQARRPFSVTFRFTLTEYNNFETWYNNTCRKGLYAFNFPKIDAIHPATLSQSDYAVYRFAEGGAPSYDNPSGDYIDCSMKWEEV